MVTNSNGGSLMDRSVKSVIEHCPTAALARSGRPVWDEGKSAAPVQTAVESRRSSEHYRSSSPADGPASPRPHAVSHERAAVMGCPTSLKVQVEATRNGG